MENKNAYTGDDKKVTELKEEDGMKLYLVRHGETDWNKAKKVQGHSDIPLNDYGRELARKTAQGLKDVPFAVAYTSPLVRARETAQLILAGRNVPLIEDRRIMELGFGIGEGMQFRGENKDPRSEDFDKFFNDTAHYVPLKDGETILELEERVGDFLKDLYADERWKDKDILIATHGAALAAMLNCFEGQKDISKFWEGGVSRNCAVTIVEVENGSPKILEQGIIYY